MAHNKEEALKIAQERYPSFDFFDWGVEEIPDIDTPGVIYFDNGDMSID